MERRLAAVLIADVVGYGRLSQTDEEGTRARFQADMEQVFEPKIAAYRGRLIKTMGDGLLVEFPSVVDALRCAVEIQREKAERRALAPPEQRLDFRIGVNLGDIIVEGDDIHGDGVNVAARLEGIAQPGGIAVSGTVHDHIGNHLDVEFVDIGDHSLKNIERPVRVWRWVTEPTAGVAAGEPLSPPDRPSIAVLPFDNLSGDPEQQYFSDGITEDIITALSRVKWFFVIARNSSFTYKGRIGGREAGRPRAWSPLCTGRQRAESGRAGAHHRSAHPSGDRPAHLGR